MERFSPLSGRGLDALNVQEALTTVRASSSLAQGGQWADHYPSTHGPDSFEQILPVLSCGRVRPLGVTAVPSLVCVHVLPLPRIPRGNFTQKAHECQSGQRREATCDAPGIEPGSTGAFNQRLGLVYPAPPTSMARHFTAYRTQVCSQRSASA
jgi:hypothetical protein